MTIKGRLMIDIERGTIRFHSTETGLTILRICDLNIPKNFNPEHDQIDIAATVTSYTIAQDSLSAPRDYEPEITHKGE